MAGQEPPVARAVGRAPRDHGGRSGDRDPLLHGLPGGTEQHRILGEPGRNPSVFADRPKNSKGRLRPAIVSVDGGSIKQPPNTQIMGFFVSSSRSIFCVSFL